MNVLLVNLIESPLTKKDKTRAMLINNYTIKRIHIRPYSNVVAKEKLFKLECEQN